MMSIVLQNCNADYGSSFENANMHLINILLVTLHDSWAE